MTFLLQAHRRRRPTPPFSILMTEREFRWLIRRVSPVGAPDDGADADPAR